jgi:hypothetical protein
MGAALLLSVGVAGGVAQPFQGHRGGFGGRPAAGASRPGPGGQRKQEHLEQWMDRHSNLSLPDQQRALSNEPGFRDLPPQTQQRLRDSLTRLNSMPPEQRRRLVERNEIMEHLSPAQQQQFRGSLQELGRLPEDRRRLVARAFNDLREMPQPQRQAVLGSDRFRGQFSDEERNTLSNLLAVEPYIPVQHSAEGPAVGK